MSDHCPDIRNWPCATGVAHRGTLKPDISDGSVLLLVVVKLAFNDNQRDALRKEYEVYHCLRSKGGLKGITTLGLLAHVSCSSISLVTELERVLLVSERKSLLTLESIHHAGILHGELENILVNDSGVTIINFGYSKQSGDQEAKAKECALLRYFLRMRK